MASRHRGVGAEDHQASYDQPAWGRTTKAWISRHRASKLAVSSLFTGSHVILEVGARASPGKLRFGSHGRCHHTLDGGFFSY